MIEPDDGWLVTALLCDAAQVADGKLYVLGGGWSVTGPGPFAHALALKLGVPWDEANRAHQLHTVLLDEDGQDVMVGEPPQQIAMTGDFEVGRPPGTLPGTPLDVAFAVNFGPMALPPGRGYAWSVRIDGAELERVSFRIRPEASR